MDFRNGPELGYASRDLKTNMPQNELVLTTMDTQALDNPHAIVDPKYEGMFAVGVRSVYKQGDDDVSKCARGTSTYIGNGSFLIAGHCCRQFFPHGSDQKTTMHVLRQNIGEVKFDKLAYGRVDGCIEVKPYAYLDGRNAKRFLDSNYKIEHHLDIAVLRVVDPLKAPPNEFAVLPGLPSSKTPYVTLVGFNDEEDSTAIIDRYPIYMSKDGLDTIFNKLLPGQLSYASARATFSRLEFAEKTDAEYEEIGRETGHTMKLLKRDVKFLVGYPDSISTSTPDPPRKKAGHDTMKFLTPSIKKAFTSKIEEPDRGQRLESRKNFHDLDVNAPMLAYPIGTLPGASGGAVRNGIDPSHPVSEGVESKKAEAENLHQEIRNLEMKILQKNERIDIANGCLDIWAQCRSQERENGAVGETKIAHTHTALQELADTVMEELKDRKSLRHKRTLFDELTNLIPELELKAPGRLIGIHSYGFMHEFLVDGKSKFQVEDYPDSANLAVSINTEEFRNFYVDFLDDLLEDSRIKGEWRRWLKHSSGRSTTHKEYFNL